MQHTAHTAPGAAPGNGNGNGNGSRRPAFVAALATVVSVLLTALGVVAPPPGTTAERPVGAAAPAAHTGPLADDGCDTACTVRAATRQEPHGEQPTPNTGCPARCGQGADGTASPLPRLRAPAEPPPSTEPHALRDRGRAPPSFSGI
ncbi:hypothetical protein ACHBTE_01310 [Streptomyces sp. M41]|uniref:hypothetical protein n=1 Tax=Streptomyces sp. M41 TaxID=3059412 RepID=UPI00374DA549